MPRLNPFTAVRDWYASRTIARDLFLTLQRIRGPGRGINIPVHKKAAPETARAVDLVLQHHPETCVQVWADGSLFLCFRDDVALLDLRARQDVEVGAAMQGMSFTVHSEDLVVRTDPMREQEPPAPVKHEPRWPGALEGRDPRDVPDREMAEFRLARAEAELAAARDAAARQADGAAVERAPQVNLTVVAGSGGVSVDVRRGGAPGAGKIVGPDGEPGGSAA